MLYLIYFTAVTYAACSSSSRTSAKGKAGRSDPWESPLYSIASSKFKKAKNGYAPTTIKKEIDLAGYSCKNAGLTPPTRRRAGFRWKAQVGNPVIPPTAPKKHLLLLSLYAYFNDD